MSGKIFYIIGKSSTGKDSLLSEILSDKSLQLKEIVQYTTRPIRDGEEEGKEYHFITNEQLDGLKKAGKVIEQRTYHTIYGDWHYLMADDGSVDLENNFYATVGTIESYRMVRDYFSAEKVMPIYIHVETGERLFRALARERKHDNPKYTEMCRRFIADENDFDEEHLKQAGLIDTQGNIVNCIENDVFADCLKQVKELIQSVE